MFRNEIFEVGHHVVMHLGFEFDDSTTGNLGVILVNGVRRDDGNISYAIKMERDGDDTLYYWTITEVQPFDSSKMKDGCVFVYNSKNIETEFDSKYRPLSESEINEIKILVGVDDPDIPY